jgi:hypothetical protein
VGLLRAFGVVLAVGAAVSGATLIPSRQSLPDSTQPRFSATIVRADLDLDPKVIRAGYRTPWILAYVETPGYDPRGINIRTITLADSVLADPTVMVFGDHDADRVPDVMFRFPRADLERRLAVGANRVAMAGRFKTGERIQAVDFLLVMDRPATLAALRVASPIAARLPTFQTPPENPMLG